jgi:uncharacterized protein (DUF58 family)
VKLIRSIYLSKRLYQLLGLLVFLFLLSYGWESFYAVAWTATVLVTVLLLLDCYQLYHVRQGLEVHRVCADRLSNGDSNEIHLYLESHYRLPVKVEIIDEVPVQFQLRGASFSVKLGASKADRVSYGLRPVKRGVYEFGAINTYVTTQLGMACRRYRFEQKKEVSVYPSYIQMRKYELMAISSNLTEYGIKKIRKVGHNMEFDHIKEYVSGDDYRTLNWKATARRGSFMVNTFQDEKSQQVFAVIDKGRVMKMPFEEMSLLDYAINAGLAISNIAIRKHDKAGLITFYHKLGTVLPASSRNGQMNYLMEALYSQKTSFKESDFEALYTGIKYKLNQRSLLLLFTNFETVASMHRQLPYLRKIAKDHLLVTIFFENTELGDLINKPATTLQEVYTKTVAEQFAFEKRLIVKELNHYGIHAILTAPKDLTVKTINKYLELKARGLI